MRRLLVLTAFAFLLGFGVLVAGCGGGGDQQEQTTTQEQQVSPQPEATGSIAATVNFNGEPPQPETYDASGNPECGVDQIESRSVVDNDNGTLKNAVVAVKSAPSSIDQSTEELTIKQNNCMYHPHVATAKIGQTVQVGDEDTGMHNVRGATKSGRQLFNLTTFKGQTKDFTLENTGVISLQCDVHPWMQSWLYVTEHGAASVTGDQGNASLNNLPTGKYTLEFWHEKYGTKTKEVTVKQDEETSVSVTYGSST